MTDPTTLPTYGAVRRSWVRSRERDYRAETNGYPTTEQRAQWAAEFDRWADRWADAIRAEAWNEGHRSGWADGVHPADDHITANLYRKD